MRSLSLDVLDLRERRLSLDDAQGTVSALLLDEVVELARLVDVGRDVDRTGRRHLAAAGKLERELRLAQRPEDALRLRDEVGLAQPADRISKSEYGCPVLRIITFSTFSFCTASFTTSTTSHTTL